MPRKSWRPTGHEPSWWSEDAVDGSWWKSEPWPLLPDRTRRFLQTSTTVELECKADAPLHHGGGLDADEDLKAPVRRSKRRASRRSRLFDFLLICVVLAVFYQHPPRVGRCRRRNGLGHRDLDGETNRQNDSCRPLDCSRERTDFAGNKFLKRFETRNSFASAPPRPMSRPGRVVGGVGRARCAQSHRRSPGEGAELGKIVDTFVRAFEVHDLAVRLFGFRACQPSRSSPASLRRVSQSSISGRSRTVISRWGRCSPSRSALASTV